MEFGNPKVEKLCSKMFDLKYLKFTQYSLILE